jgi:hypothetical protein
MQTMLFGWLTVPMEATASGARPRSGAARGSRAPIAPPIRPKTALGSLKQADLWRNEVLAARNFRRLKTQECGLRTLRNFVQCHFELLEVQVSDNQEGQIFGKLHVWSVEIPDTWKSGTSKYQESRETYL